MTITDPDAKRMAHGELELVRAFVNTWDVLDDKDEIRTPEQAAGWLSERGLLGPRTKISGADHGRLIDLREGLRRLAMTNNGEKMDPASLRVLNAAARVPLVLRFTQDGAAIGAEGGQVEAAIGKIVGIVYNAIAEGTWGRLKACSDDSCLWLFYDHSKNKSKSWCNMAVCGNRAKAKAYRERVKGSKG